MRCGNAECGVAGIENFWAAVTLANDSAYVSKTTSMENVRDGKRLEKRNVRSSVKRPPFPERVS